MQKIAPPIVVITTGGTIDKAYLDALSAYKIGEPTQAQARNPCRTCFQLFRSKPRQAAIELVGNRLS